jgi:hypothetical protein
MFPKIELSRFGKQEDWIIADEATTITALPNKFATAVNTILVSLFGIVQSDDVRKIILLYKEILICFFCFSRFCSICARISSRLRIHLQIVCIN